MDSRCASRSFSKTRLWVTIALVNLILAFTANAGTLSGPCTPTSIIADGTFEAGTPWPAWTIQTSANFGTPLCSVFLCGVGGGSANPFEGDNWAWFGGVVEAEASTAGQTVVIPAGGGAALSFQLRIGTVSKPFGDVLNVKVDGAVVRTFAEPAEPEDNYTLRTINLNAFADGAPHTVLFEYIHAGTGLSNFTIDNVSLLSGCSGKTAFDYDGDGRSDVSVFRPTDGNWYLQRSFEGFTAANFGVASDRIVPADFDADGNTDIAVYRPSEGNWYISNSSDGSFTAVSFGIAEDLPVPADFDADGRADIAVFRPSVGTWFISNSSNGTFTFVQFGTTGDKPTIGDFDGDGIADIGVFRPSNGTWYRTDSSTGQFAAEQFGLADDKIAPADYDGDGRTDIAVYRPSSGSWFIKNSSDGTFTAVNFGISEDIPVPGDFDGDGRADISVFRPSIGTWFVANSLNGTFTILQFGQTGDRPTQNAFGN